MFEIPVDDNNFPAMSGSDAYSVSSNCDFAICHACNVFFMAGHDILCKRNYYR